MPASERGSQLTQLSALLREAGTLALSTFQGARLKSWTKGESSPVSEADIAVNDFLQASLPDIEPDAAWLSEETEDDLSRTNSDRVWIVDPIDGTRAYIGGRTDWSIAVALAQRGRPVLAALYAPATDEMFLAAAGEGASLNGNWISAKAGDDLGGARIAGPQSYLRRLSEIAPDFVSEPKIHSLALRLTRVAQGTLDAAFASRNSHDWDVAAADLLVHEAGGRLTDLSGRALTYNKPHAVHSPLLAGGTARHSALIGLLHERQTLFG